MTRYEVHFLAEAIVDIDTLFCYIAKETSFKVAARYLARIERILYGGQNLEPVLEKLSES